MRSLGWRRAALARGLARVFGGRPPRDDRPALVVALDEIREAVEAVARRT